jgi:hypothetical protein
VVLVARTVVASLLDRLHAPAAAVAHLEIHGGAVTVTVAAPDRRWCETARAVGAVDESADAAVTVDAAALRDAVASAADDEPVVVDDGVRVDDRDVVRADAGIPHPSGDGEWPIELEVRAGDPASTVVTDLGRKLFVPQQTATRFARRAAHDFVLVDTGGDTFLRARAGDRDDVLLWARVDTEPLVE